MRWVGSIGGICKPAMVASPKANQFRLWRKRNHSQVEHSRGQDGGTHHTPSFRGRRRRNPNSGGKSRSKHRRSRWPGGRPPGAASQSTANRDKLHLSLTSPEQFRYDRSEERQKRGGLIVYGPANGPGLEGSTRGRAARRVGGTQYLGRVAGIPCRLWMCPSDHRAYEVWV